MNDEESIRLALSRHQRRREQGVPTLTVFAGPREAALRSWQDWVGSMGWPPARVINIEEEDAADLSAPAGAMLYMSAFTDGPTHALAGFVEKVVRFLVSRGQDQTGTPLALAVRAVDAQTYLRDEPYSRARAIFAEGIIDLSAPVAAAISTVPARVFASLTSQNARPETIKQFAAAAEARQQLAAPEANDETADRARSAAERFLFDLLNDLPETAGRFELNARLGFCFGPMPAEIDLLADDLRLAVEIDGYHHFRDPENYRRDRRKDALLQRQGYLVLRFLAEDVVVRLEDILEEIRAAVAFRRATRG